MSERRRKTSGKDSGSARTEKTESISSEQSYSPHKRDFEVQSNEGKTRASSWDDSDDTSPPILDSGGSRTSRIYSNDSKSVRQSTEIEELKKQFLEVVEKEKTQKEHSVLDMKGELDMQSDRRRSPARMRRRTKSPDSSSPPGELEISLENLQKFNILASRYEELPSKYLECDPAFYLNNFFSELKSRRISLIDTIPAGETLGGEIPANDRDTTEISNELRAKHDDEYFFKAYKKLSQILEVDESRKDLQNNSEETITVSPFHQKELKLPSNSSSPLQTSRSKISRKSLENNSKTGEEKFQKISSEHLKNFNEFQATRGSFSERCLDFIEKRDDESISLSAKSGKTHLLSPICDKTQVQQFSLDSPVGSTAVQEFRCEIEKKEKDVDLQESLKLDFNQSSGNPTPRKSIKSDRSQTNRTLSGRSWNLESPRFPLNIEEDSVKSLKVEDVDELDSNSRVQSDERNSRTSNNLSRSRRSSGTKTARNFRVGLGNLESANSRSSKETETKSQNSSHKQSAKHRKHKNFEENGGFESAESNLSVDKSRSCSAESYKSSEKSQRGGKSYKLEGDGGSPDYKSSRILKFVKEKKVEDKPMEHSIQKSPRSSKIVEMDLSQPRDFQKKSNRSIKSVEFQEWQKESDCSTGNTPKQRSQRSNRKSSERVINTRSKNAESRNSTPRSFELTPMGKSRDNLDNQIELENFSSARAHFSKEFENCHFTNNTPVSSTSRTSLKELDIPTQQISCRSEDSDEYSGRVKEMENNLKIQLPGSRKSSERSPSSHAPESAQVRSARSTRIKSRPNSWISSDRNSEIPQEVENLDVTSAKTNRSLTSEVDDEEKETQSTRTPKMEDECDRHSTDRNKKLSIINEVSFENLNSNGESSDNEEKNFYKQNITSRNSKRESPESLTSYRNPKGTPVNTPSSSDSSLKKKSLTETVPSECRRPDEKWNELIETFQNSNSPHKLENNFPGFQDKNDISWDLIKDSFLESRKYSECECEKEIAVSKPIEDEEFEKNGFFEKSTVEGDITSVNTAQRDNISEKIGQDEGGQNPQNIFYFNVSQGGPFGIGEFGDITSWNDAQFDNTDIEKPKDHGDGTRQKNPQIFTRKSEKKQKETTTQRELWTGLRKDNRDSRPSLENLLVDVEDDLMNFISNHHETPKTKNWAERKEREKSKTITVSSPFTDFTDKPEVVENKFPEFRNTKMEGKSPTKSTIQQQSNSEYSSEEEDFAFLYKRSPRRSRSLFEFNIQLQEMKNKDLESEKFQKEFYNFDKDKQLTNLNIFLAHKERERIDLKSNNWFESKSSTIGSSQDGGRKENLPKRDEKVKFKSKKKDATPVKESYLTSGKTRVPNLKLRNRNCFQNLYKRFIGVFCLTSNSSAATSK